MDKDPSYEKSPKKWSTFSSHSAPEIYNTFGEEFNEIYNNFEQDGSRVIETIPNARELFHEIIGVAISTGTLYLCNRDFTHIFNPLNMYGPIDSPNLCTEVDLPRRKWGDPMSGPVDINDHEAAICTLSSLCIPQFIGYNPILDTNNLGPKDRTMPMFNYAFIHDDNEDTSVFIYPHGLENIFGTRSSYYYSGLNGSYINYARLGIQAYTTCLILNATFTRSNYVSPGAALNHLHNRPIGVSQQGLMDAIIMLGIDPTSEDAHKINRDVAGVIYYFTILASCDLARENGKPFPGYETSQWSRGKFQFDLRNDYIKEMRTKIDNDNSLGTYAKNKFLLDLTNLIVPIPWLNWEYLRNLIKLYGVFNGTMTTLVPGESTSKAQGNSEMCEPRKSAVYAEKNNGKVRYVYNPHLLKCMQACGWLNDEFISIIESNRGSVQNTNIPDEFKKLFLTIYEFPHKHLLRQAIEREPYIDMSQSFNIHLDDPVIETIESLLLYAHRNMLKTPCYYIRTKVASTLSVITDTSKNTKQKPTECVGDVCELCT
jgi:ribonucleotide reductase alpha subunit